MVSIMVDLVIRPNFSSDSHPKFGICLLFWNHVTFVVSLEVCPMAERSRFYVLPPSVSVLCPSQGRARTKVQREQGSHDTSQPGLSRMSNRPLPGSQGPNHCLHSSRVV